MINARDIWIIIAAIFILGIIIIFFTSVNKQSDDLYNNLLGKKDFSQNTTSSQNNESQETNQGTSGGGDGSTGGSNSGGSNSGSNPRNCTTKQIAYSMLDYNKTEICNTFQGEICIDKTVYCSIEIQNRDNASGSFEVELFFVEIHKSIEEKFDSKKRTFSLGADETYVFDDSTHIESLGENGLANKGINCYYINSIVPVKEVCE